MLATLPVNTQTKMKTILTPKNRPDGTIICDSDTSGSSTTTTCRQGKTLVFVPHTYEKSYDANEKTRDAMISSCTENRCIERYGNSLCKINTQTVSSREDSSGYNQSRDSDKEGLSGDALDEKDRDQVGPKDLISPLMTLFLIMF